MGLCLNENKIEEIPISNKNIMQKSNGIIKINSIIADVSKSVFNVFNYDESLRCSGFLIKFNVRDQEFFFLMTSAHFIDKYMIKNREKIHFYYDINKTKRKELYLNPDERFIQNFLYPNHLDATIIEILPEDNISKDFFLLPDLNYMSNLNTLVDKKIIIVHYPLDQLSYSEGKIININNYEFTHNSCTEKGSSGCPIFLEDSNKVLGIHKSGDINNNAEYADFIWPIYKYLIDNNVKIKSHPISSPNNEPISIHFMTNDQNINYSIPSYPKELFSDVVSKLYAIYPEYKDRVNCFLCNGHQMELNYTMAQNQYKSGDKILVINQ